jgi:hypothetical protein
MRTVRFNFGKVDISDEVVQEYEKTLGLQPSEMGRKLLDFAMLDRRYIQAYLQNNGYPVSYLMTMGMLESHGFSDGDQFLYSDLVDGKLEWYPVEDWIREHDGRYPVLYISVCNRGESVLEPCKSTLVYYMGSNSGNDIALENMGKGSGKIRVILPK